MQMDAKVQAFMPIHGDKIFNAQISLEYSPGFVIKPEHRRAFCAKFALRTGNMLFWSISVHHSLIHSYSHTQKGCTGSFVTELRTRYILYLG
jgi:hypothetical protein